MIRTYNLKRAEDVIELAKYVQTQVYWRNTFCDVTNNLNNVDRVYYKYFWDYCDSYMSEGCTRVVICDEIVEFKRHGK